MKNFVAMLCAWLVGMPLSAGGPRMNDRHAVEAVQHFVQSFYDWYVPKALGDSPGPGWKLALETKQSSFSHELAFSLREDSEAQARANGEIVGLDFDPFLNSQDPETQYKVGRITQEAEKYSVSIYSVSSGKIHPKPAVIAEVSSIDGHWHFVDFRYPDGRNLLSILEALKKSGDQHPHR